ncbi:hypothetical protein MRB53_027621 [Persea americana]|uniref:Uncharacterized protein n=1 Tax=Persea americana TaxID=3435 RepID=A0ACC2LLN2_PERAE|nr:hypothetical protein MRB53_027621 [Persea americana]
MRQRVSSANVHRASGAPITPIKSLRSDILVSESPLSPSSSRISRSTASAPPRGASATSTGRRHRLAGLFALNLAGESPCSTSSFRTGKKTLVFSPSMDEFFRLSFAGGLASSPVFSGERRWKMWERDFC